VIKLSAAARYAVRTLAYLATWDANAHVTSHAVARACGVPEKYLLKVCKLLAAARLLHSLRGPNGGYRLARPAKAITLLEIVEGVDGPLRGLAPAVEAPDGGKLNRQLAAVCDQACGNDPQRAAERAAGGPGPLSAGGRPPRPGSRLGVFPSAFSLTASVPHTWGL
jgi:Rrf2 family protein